MLDFKHSCWIPAPYRARGRLFAGIEVVQRSQMGEEAKPPPSTLIVILEELPRWPVVL